MVNALGSEVLKADGSLDRARVRSIVFRDDDARRRLENIIHPIVRRLRETWVQAQKDEGADLIVCEIPLLFETGRAEDFDCVVVVDAPYDTRLSRMIEFRGLSEEEARREFGDVTIYQSDFKPMKHTLSGRDERSLMKLVVDSDSERVLGLHMVGPDAGEILQGMAIALRMGATKADFDRTVGIHPTAAEELVTMREPLGN